MMEDPTVMMAAVASRVRHARPSALSSLSCTRCPAPASPDHCSLLVVQLTSCAFLAAPTLPLTVYLAASFISCRRLPSPSSWFTVQLTSLCPVYARRLFVPLHCDPLAFRSHRIPLISPPSVSATTAFGATWRLRPLLVTSSSPMIEDPASAKPE